LSYSLEVNCKIIDACMRLHNFIVEHQNEDESIFRKTVDFEIFDDDCRRFYAVNAFENNEGVYGGEEDVCHNSNETAAVAAAALVAPSAIVVSSALKALTASASLLLHHHLLPRF
jgi:hypothetical protein